MDKLEYLKLAIENNLPFKKEWIISTFTIANTSDQYKYDYQLHQRKDGHYFFLESELVKIKDSDPSSPLFQFTDNITVDNSMCENVSKPIDTIIGNLMFNLISITSSFKDKIPFITGRTSVSKIEDIISSRLHDDIPLEDRKPDHIYVDEYLKFIDSLPFIRSLAQICTVVTTPKSITAPPGLAEFKQSLVEKYGDTLTDPAQLAKFKQELQEFDKEYMKDDPTYGKFLSGKTMTAREKIHLSLGAEKGFSEDIEVIPVVNSLEEGWSTDPKEFTAMMNASRFGSHARGSLTALGGAGAKVLLRATNVYKIINEDCGTTLGLPRTLLKYNIDQLRGREIRVGNKWVKVTNETDIKEYVGKEVIVRSPMYCKTTGYNICGHCVGDLLAINPDGIPTDIAELGSILLNSVMKLMHSKALQTHKLDINSAFS